MHLLCLPLPRSPTFSPNSASRLFQPRHYRNLQRCCIRVGMVISVPIMHHHPSSQTRSGIRQPRRMSFVLFFPSISPRTALQPHDVRATICPRSTRVLPHHIRRILLRMYPTQRLPYPRGVPDLLSLFTTADFSTSQIPWHLNPHPHHGGLPVTLFSLFVLQDLHPLPLCQISRLSGNILVRYLP